MDESQSPNDKTPRMATDDEIRSMSEEEALRVLTEMFAASSDPFWQKAAKDPQHVYSIYAEIRDRE